MKILSFFLFVFLWGTSYAQLVQQRLQQAVARLEKDEQMQHASFSLYVVNSKTGVPVFQKNEQVGLAPASTQKVVTAASAFELLGDHFQYQSSWGYNGKIENGILLGSLVFKGSGDPTLGSWRWKQTLEDSFAAQVIASLKEKNITAIKGNIFIDNSNWESQATPNGWIWEDIGNYYGAGAWAVNWHENQYDLWMKPGKKTGDSIEILYTDPVMQSLPILNEVKTAAAGSGDNTIIYLPENGKMMVVRGTIPAGVDKFKVSGSFPDAPLQMGLVLKNILKKAGIAFSGELQTTQQFQAEGKKQEDNFTSLGMLRSPTLDSMSYWFLKSSINLYGECLIKTMAFQKNGFGTTGEGLDIVKNLWSGKGIDKSALNMKDGSGLSPANRITTHALVTVLQYARKQPWYNSFYNGLPLINALKMKSGSINNVRSYAGYIKSKTGAEYSFAFIINNFDGSASAIKNKMFQLLDVMKAN